MAVAASTASATDALSWIGKAAISLATYALLAWSGASVLCALWNWFLSPIGASQITLPLAWGLCTLHTFLWCRGYQFPAEAAKTTWDQQAIRGATKAAMYWSSCGVGWVIHHYWMSGR